MSRPVLWASLLAAVQSAWAAPADPPPVAGQDYYSWQITSGSLQGLEPLYQRYSTLSYVRMERRGPQYVLRAGFWPSRQAARDHLPADLPKQALIRVATYRPETITRQNWPQALPATRTVATPQATTQAVPDTPDATAVAAAPPPPTRAPAPPAGGAMRAFNQADYALAFDAFLGAGDLQRAFQLASHAVASVPADTDWRRKLARLSEWTSRPETAWIHWAYLFQHGDHSPETVQAVLRLAPLTGEPEVAIAAWVLRLDQGPLNTAQWADLFTLYESAGKAEQGSRLFEAQYRKSRDPALLEQAARLAENRGDDPRALQLYAERAGLKPFSMDAALRAVVLLIRRDRMQEAYALMQQHREEVPPEATDFWRLLANTAWELQEVDAAITAYQHYANSPQATGADWSRLIFLVRQRFPLQAADLALLAFHRFGAIDNLLLALGIYAEAADLNGQERLYRQLTPAELATAQGDARFLVLRAQYFQRARQPDRAWEDYKKALALQPDDRQIAVPVLWFLLDRGRKSELQVLLQQWAARAQTDPAYWLAFAAAHQTLDHPKEAVRWYRQEIRRNPDDALVLLNYADALERAPLPGMAARVRRHAWLQLREKHPSPEGNGTLGANPELLALARLAILNQPGDPGLQRVRQLVTQLRGVAPEPAPGDGQVQDLVLGWALSHEQFFNARSWMWLQYARNTRSGNPMPVWGQSQVALQTGDTQTMDRLLARNADQVPIHARYDMDYALERAPQALSTAFEGLQSHADDEDLHDRYRQHVPRHASYLQMRASNDTYGDLNSQSRQLDARLAIRPTLHLLLGGSYTGQSSADPVLGPFIPGAERLTRVGLHWLGHDSEGQFTVFQRDELRVQNGLQLAQAWNWSPRLTVDGELAYRVDATDNVTLRTLGSEDHAHLGVNYAIGKREYVRATSRWSRYNRQASDPTDGEVFGFGQTHTLEAGYRIRTEYPDVRVRLYATHQRYAFDGYVQTLSPTFALPSTSTTTGACLNAGENLAGQDIQDSYTRALRPFAEACTTDNSLSGVGYSGSIGIAGAITGEDHLSLRLEYNSDLNGSATRTLALRYRHYF